MALSSTLPMPPSPPAQAIPGQSMVLVLTTEASPDRARSLAAALLERMLAVAGALHFLFLRGPVAAWFADVAILFRS